MKKFKAPFVLKMHFYDPNTVNQSKNAAHIMYIGTRPGVDKGKEHELEPEQFEIRPDTPAGHVGYAHGRPRSHGLFTSGGETPDLPSVQHELASHKGVVWRMIASLEGEDAKRLGMTSRDKWEESVKAVMPNVAMRMGIPEHELKWVAAFHNEESHPHVHIVVWEANPKRKRGVVNKKATNQIKSDFIKEIYSEERDHLNKVKTQARDLLQQEGRRTLSENVRLLREFRKAQIEVGELTDLSGESVVEGVAPKLHMAQQLEMMQKLKELAALLPGRGRLNFQLMTPEVKEKVTEISDWVYGLPQFKGERDQYFDAVAAMVRPYSTKQEDIDGAVLKSKEDLLKRLSQFVLRAAAETQKNDRFEIDPVKAKIVLHEFSRAMGSFQDKVPAEVLRNVIRMLRDMGFSREEQEAILERWNRSADLKIDISDQQEILVHMSRSKSQKPIGENEIKNAVQVLTLSGYSQDEIKDWIHLKSGLDKSLVTPFVKEVEGKTKEALDVGFSSRDWKRFTDRMGLTKLEYPWITETKAVLVADDIDKVVQVFRTSVIKEELRQHDPQQVGWTAFSMAVALKQLGVNEQQRNIILNDWVQSNQIQSLDVGRILETVKKNETNFLRIPTWKRVVDNLQIQTPYPWVTREEVSISEVKYQDALSKIFEVQYRPTDRNEGYWIGEKLAQFLRVKYERIDSIKEGLQEWNNKQGVLNEIQLEQIVQSIERRDGDVEMLRKEFGIEDTTYDFLLDYAKVLFAAGQEKGEVEDIIKGWNQRTLSFVGERKIDMAITVAEKYCADLNEWGRDPVVGRKPFERLSKALNVVVPWMWRTDHQQQLAVKDNFMNMAGKIMKGAFKAIHRELKKNEAQKEQEHQKLIRKIQQQAKQEEKERENDKDRGR
jgi:hypothetical protein